MSRTVAWSSVPLGAISYLRATGEAQVEMVERLSTKAIDFLDNVRDGSIVVEGAHGADAGALAALAPPRARPAPRPAAKQPPAPARRRADDGGEKCKSCGTISPQYSVACTACGEPVGIHAKPEPEERVSVHGTGPMAMTCTWPARGSHGEVEAAVQLARDVRASQPKLIGGSR